MTANPGGIENSRGNQPVSGVIAFLRARYLYFLGFCIVEAGLYYFGGPAGNFRTGLVGLFTIWIYYSWISRK